MSSTDDPFSSLLKRTLDANYNPEIYQQEDANTTDSPTPLSFYDRHIATHLLLENIVYLPSLTQSLSRACDLELQNFLKSGHHFSNTGYAFPLECPATQFTDAHSVSLHYHRYIGNLSSRYAYKLAFHPDSQSWDSAFHMNIYPAGARSEATTEAWLEVSKKLLAKPDIVNGLSQAKTDELNSLLQKYPRLANWDVFAMTDQVQALFQTIRGDRPFEWESCRALGSYTVCHLDPPPDSNNAIVPVPLHMRKKLRRGSSKGRRVTTRSAKVVTIPNLPPGGKPNRPDFRHYIQHAWAKAAIHDSTFMIVHCGRYERIGFRHRASKTLFLSGVIDTVNIRTPSYRKLHIGLHTAIVQDALRRQRLTDKDSQKQEIPTLKRHADQMDKEAPRRKRLKFTTEARSNALRIASTIAERKLALVRLEYGAFCSPVPSSFVRRGPSCVPGFAPLSVSEEEKQHPKQTRYTANEYISLTLGEPLGHGAVGIVHPAMLQLTLDSGEILTHELVMKFAFTAEQQDLMANEYLVYGHLSRKKGVEGIVTVHGLFMDPETETLAMLMDNGGRSLRHREIGRVTSGGVMSVTGQERKAFMKALKSLHQAGIRHNDLRAENLLINSRNEVFIIDFDRADFEVGEQEIRKETRWLQDVLDGSI